jgi:uncharacterized protein YggT (Ycf19 family)
MVIAFSLRGLIDDFFRLLILCIWISVILSWITAFIPMPPDNLFGRISRFFDKLTAPILHPIARRIPRAGFMMVDLSLTVALIFSWWVLVQLDGLILSALPANW